MRPQWRQATLHRYIILRRVRVHVRAAHVVLLRRVACLARDDGRVGETVGCVLRGVEAHCGVIAKQAVRDAVRRRVDLVRAKRRQSDCETIAWLRGPAKNVREALPRRALRWARSARVSCAC